MKEEIIDDSDELFIDEPEIVTDEMIIQNDEIIQDESILGQGSQIIKKKPQEDLLKREKNIIENLFPNAKKRFDI